MARLCREVCVREQAHARREHCGEGATAESAAVRRQVLERHMITLERRPRSDVHGAASRARRSRTKARIIVGELRPISRVYDLCQVDSSAQHERALSTHTAHAARRPRPAARAARARARMRDSCAHASIPACVLALAASPACASGRGARRCAALRDQPKNGSTRYLYLIFSVRRFS